jgi:parallel beta-helix repeat protein
MLWDDSDALISNCTINGNKEGMWVLRSSPVITNCVFQGTESGAAINIIGDESKPVLEANEFNNNEDDVERQTNYTSFCYLTFLPIMTVYFLIIIYMKNEKIEE